MTSIYAEKVSAKVRLIHVEQMSSYNFIILRKKTDSKTGVFLRNLWNFQEQWWLLWKQVTYYYVGHKLVIFNAVLFTLLHLLLTRWWDMRLKHDVAWLWEEQADSRNECQNKKKYCSCCITWIKNWYHFIKNIYNFQNLLFRKLLAQLGNQTDIFWKFYSPADILWSPKTVGRVLGYTTGSCWEEIEHFLLNSTLSTNQKIVVSKTSSFATMIGPFSMLYTYQNLSACFETAKKLTKRI